MSIRPFVSLFCLALLCTTAPPASAKETQHKDALGRDYWLYTPETIDPDKTYTLVLGVHGYRGRGKGAGGMAGWVKDRDVIVLGPTYDSNGYQYLQAGSEEQTFNLIKQLRKAYKLKDKIFVYGFSGGAQFAHRFAMKHPGLVAGCAAHSAGTWGTGDYDKAVPNPAARSVLFVISCGEKDTGKSFGEAPMGRLEWAKKYAELLGKGGFVYDAQWWPDVAHRASPGSRQMTADCFEASIYLLPELKEEHATIKRLLQRRDYSAAWSPIKARLEARADLKDGLIQTVLDQYINSLSVELRRIDRWGVSAVRAAVRDNDTAEKRKAALAKLQAQFSHADALPDTAKALASAIKNLE